MAKSRYSRTRILDGNHYETFSFDQTNRFKEVDTFDDVNTFEYIIKRGDRLDHLAAKYLNDDGYWYVIALLNGKDLPFLSPGTKIRIPFDVTDVLDRI